MFKAKKIVDLSIPLCQETPVYPGDPKPKMQEATTIEREGYNILHLEIGSQTGTHVDAPYHFHSTGERIDESDLALFIGTGVIISVTGKQEQEAITLDDVELYLDQLAPSKIVLFYTGWSQYADQKKYFRHPYVHVDVIHEMIQRGIRTFFIDAINIDRTGDSTFPVHHEIAQVNGIIAENVTNLEAIDFPEPLICAFPLKIKGADGAPIRAVAIEQE